MAWFMGVGILLALAMVYRINTTENSYQREDEMLMLIIVLCVMLVVSLWT